jgi:hypothetical protein
MHGPTEILRTPDNHYIIVTREWWKSFLSTHRGTGTDGVAEVR